MDLRSLILHIGDLRLWSENYIDLITQNCTTTTIQDIRLENLRKIEVQTKAPIRKSWPDPNCMYVCIYIYGTAYPNLTYIVFSKWIISGGASIKNPGGRVTTDFFFQSFDCSTQVNSGCNFFFFFASIELSKLCIIYQKIEAHKPRSVFLS